MSIRINSLIAAALAAMVAFAAINPAAYAHHGWRWAEGENSEVTGKVVSARLGNPHGEVTLEVDGEEWTAEVGQPWRNDRAGLTAELLSAGTTITIRGHRSTDPDAKLIKAERVIIAGETYDLYPGRD